MREHFRYATRVCYIDTDQGGVAHHSAYLRWLEAARIEYMRAHRGDYRVLELESKIALPVVRAEIVYRRPARFDDQLEVECWVGDMGRSMVRFDSCIWEGASLLTEAKIALAAVRLPEMRACAIPEDLRKVLERISRRT